MDIDAFLADAPEGQTTPLGGVGAQYELRFGGEGLLEELSDFDSFDDLMDDMGIESWETDFATVFPHFTPIAVAAEPEDSGSEFLLLVDTSKETNPVVLLRADAFDWDEFEESKEGFEELADSFSEFIESLEDYVEPED